MDEEAAQKSDGGEKCNGGSQRRKRPKKVGTIYFGKRDKSATCQSSKIPSLAAVHLYYTVVLDLSKQRVWISTGTRNAQIPATVQLHDQLNLLIAPRLGFLCKAEFEVCVTIVEAAKNVDDSFEVHK
ncbi:hypothetical protein HGM15179_008419 [Zosterops borbonicus]|uniref:Uncharacterized protein n=1 Tax=Zosterops borbonicus TaxID=364589 RepID=A0A8K1GGY4_9PASS|nr:hypothetical protein HGM15179_008419 [Zosterops borbonicus]